jgi:hypothetical protein
MFAVALVVGRRAGNKSPSKIIRWGFLLLAVGVAILIPIVPRAHSGWWMVIPLLIAGTGLRLLHLDALLVGKPPRDQAEILRINTKVRPRALQIALLIPLLAALLGLLNGFRMTRLPDPEPSAAAEGVLGG